jgi:hypothetical protein
MPRKEAWTSISVTKSQFDIIDRIHQDTKLSKHHIVELALRDKFSGYFPDEANAI